MLFFFFYHQKALHSVLLNSIKEKGNSILELRTCKDKNIKSINENNSSIQSLRQQRDKYKDMEMEMNEHCEIDCLKEQHDARKTLEGNLSAALLRLSPAQVQAENSESVIPTTTLTKDLTTTEDDKIQKVIPCVKTSMNP